MLPATHYPPPLSARAGEWGPRCPAERRRPRPSARGGLGSGCRVGGRGAATGFGGYAAWPLAICTSPLFARDRRARQRPSRRPTPHPPTPSAERGRRAGRTSAPRPTPLHTFLVRRKQASKGAAPRHKAPPRRPRRVRRDGSGCPSPPRRAEGGTRPPRARAPRGGAFPRVGLPRLGSSVTQQLHYFDLEGGDFEAGRAAPRSPAPRPRCDPGPPSPSPPRSSRAAAAARARS